MTLPAPSDGQLRSPTGSTLSGLLADHTSLPGHQVAHLQRLVSEWQLLADLSFSDLTLWVRSESGERYVCVAQVRPTTGATAQPTDLVGRPADAELADELTTVVGDGSDFQICSAGVRVVHSGAVVERTLVPIELEGQLVAVLVQDAVDRSGRGPSAMETAYLDAAQSIFGMVSEGSFPPILSGEMHTGPRAGDGFLRLNPDGTVEFGSPNAQSAYHRLGYPDDLAGADLASVTRPLIHDPFDGAELAARISGAVQGQWSLRMEIEGKGATVLFRSLPLLIAGVPSGALVLVRDVTEVRRRDRALLSKDATIREIHHRVKNNLQTVAALLRLQARRSADVAVQQALGESVRRVASIALVHEMLSTAPDDRVDLDQIVDRLVPMISDVAALEKPARINREGSFGTLRAELATPLVMVLAEVTQNAMQHAYPDGGEGKIVQISVNRTAAEVQVSVIDDGVGPPVGFSLERSNGLGLQIVRTLVDSELGGSIGFRNRADQGLSGTEVLITVPLRRR